MRISIKRQLAMRLAVAVGFAALQATLATTALATPSHVRHHSAAAASSAYRASHDSWGNPGAGYAADSATVLSPRYYYPNPFAGQCTEDDGYGRFKPCDSGP
jgi:microcystin degradation protein MlrC